MFYYCGNPLARLAITGMWISCNTIYEAADEDEFIFFKIRSLYVQILGRKQFRIYRIYFDQIPLFL